jgi:group I intron endonuclease
MNIYKITNIINGLIYIGQEKNYNPSYYGSGILIKKAISELGIDNFKKEIIEYCKDHNELNEREIFWIKELNSRNPSVGYNLAPGGSLFMTSPEISKKISNTLKGKYVGEKAFRYGLKITEEHKKKISEANRGKEGIENKMWPEERRKKASEKRKGIKLSDITKERLSKAHTGKKLTEEHKKKISEGLENRTYTDEIKEKLRNSNINKKQKNSKTVNAENIETKEVIFFNNISQCSRFFNVTRQRVKENTVTGWEINVNKEE